MNQLRPLDLVVAFGALTLMEGQGWTQAALASRLGISQPAVHRALAQLRRSQLWSEGTSRPRHAALLELVVHGARYVFPAQPGAPARGVVTAHAAPSLAVALRSSHAYVWPHEAGPHAGVTIEPLHACVPAAALRSPAFHELLALTDVFRVGRARERRAAAGLLAQHLGLES